MTLPPEDLRARLESPATDRDSTAESLRWVDRLEPRLVNALTIAGFAIPALLYLWMLASYSVNVVVGDQWDNVPVISASYHQMIPWHAMWAQHNENRMFFPNALVIVLSRMTQFNVQLEEIISATLLFASTALIIWTHKRRSVATPWLYYCPVACMALAITQWENTLWGFQVAWYMILFALAAALFLLDRTSVSVFVFCIATVAAIIGSLSSVQGLLVWAAGLVLLYHRRRPWPYIVAWVAVAGGTAAVYFHNFILPSNPEVDPNLAFTHPLLAVKFYVFLIGDVVGINPQLNHVGSYPWVTGLGILLVVLAVFLLVVYGIRRDSESSSPLGLSLIVMGLLFGVLVTKGRIFFGYVGAGASRYTTMDVLVPIGIYLTLIARKPDSMLNRRTPVDEPHRSFLDRITAWSGKLATWADASALTACRVLIGMAVVVLVWFSVPNGLHGASQNHRYQAEAVPIMRNITTEPNGQVVYHLYLFMNASYVRKQAEVLMEHHLSVYADPPRSG